MLQRLPQRLQKRPGQVHQKNRRGVGQKVIGGFGKGGATCDAPPFFRAQAIVAVSEISKRSSFLGGLFASLPLTSFLAMLWLYHDTKDAAKVAALSTSIFWLVLPSLIFFIAMPALLKMNFSFYTSFAVATVIMLACYGITLLALNRFRPG